MLTPLGRRLLLRMPAAPAKIGSIWLPPSVQQDYTLCQAEIIAVGPTVRDSRLAPGVRVVTRRFGSVALDDAKREWTVNETDVLAIVEEEEA